MPVRLTVTWIGRQPCSVVYPSGRCIGIDTVRIGRRWYCSYHAAIVKMDRLIARLNRPYKPAS